MLEKLSQLIRAIQNIQNPVEYNIESFRKVLQEINAVKFDSLSDNRLQEISAELKSRACKGVSLDSLLVDAFALVREVSRRVLGMYPFDTQVLASIALHKGKIVEMQTGEGKTLAAVMSAYLNALEGKGVHVLTFNDYLARRDAQWMGPIYEFLGLTIGYVNEGMSITERQKAYSANITYVTAKEAGFDYLRDFLCMEEEKLVHRPFHYAIVDEADSILIDEARVPLVIAGNVQEEEENPLHLSKLRGFKQGIDYEIDQYKSNVYFTDSGLLRLEKVLGCGNLYDSKNLELLARLNCELYAEVLIERDKDYIVRNGKVELIDEFTGRIAAKRRWPENLQAAVEAKEGLRSEFRGTIMGSIALQYFLNLYSRISGMTGTGSTAAAEFREFYCMDVVVIPPNKLCIRKDHSDIIFTHKEAKQKAIVLEVERVHTTGQPILIGTESVEESELLAIELRKTGIECRILNAKNDEMEAKIIAKAGEVGAVTVSTNMAGRGIDIKLGGEKEQGRDKVVASGGLYVLGTNRHESRRIDNQLRGRGGRQGDPGESRFFISLEDDLIKRYDIGQLIWSREFPQKQEGAVNEPAILRAVIRGQRIVEGYNSDIRRQLWKYSFIIEQQRRIIHNKRQDILWNKISLDVLSSKAADRYCALQAQVGEDILRKVEKQITLYHINKCWADYLDYISYEREGIHLVAIGKKDPLTEFHRIAIEAFDEMMDKIDSEIIRTFNTVAIGEDGIDMVKAGLKGPSATWTYLINDSSNQFSRLPNLIKAAIGKIKVKMGTFLF
ncbi:accessory Sec system translocase SecA2 [Pelosinus baikalensis]|uniref:Protein translocase subunit SecA n=1 Tax=Pelosinus baikalensis TaxID=2892015 RepID=A0ABS8HQC5_9FIRM|nr:accessory Sec system translocase SecA2 [Pelosinus baikalensis]MCC5465388.1 accessory Sec system translocase SecA2 [Pelosinus baikalensis]